MPTLCKLTKSDPKKARKKGASPHYVCKKCGKAAGKKKWLCKPIKIDE